MGNKKQDNEKNSTAWFPISFAELFQVLFMEKDVIVSAGI